MVREIQDYWDSADIDYLVKMTKSDMLELLDSIAAKYSNQKYQSQFLMTIQVLSVWMRGD